jgi:hypothetical protein
LLAYLTHDHTRRALCVAARVKDLQQTHGAPGVKQRLAAARMLFAERAGSP